MLSGVEKASAPVGFQDTDIVLLLSFQWRPLILVPYWTLSLTSGSKAAGILERPPLMVTHLVARK